MSAQAQLTQAQKAEFTNLLVAQVSTYEPVKRFFSSLFTPISAQAAIAKWNNRIVRNYRATDVADFTAPANVNKFAIQSQSSIFTPAYKESFTLDGLDSYKSLINSNDPTVGMLTDLVAETSFKVNAIQDKIRNNIEYQATTLLFSDTMTYANPLVPTTMGRGAWSKIAYTSGNNFASNSVNIFDRIGAFIKSLREHGSLPGNMEFLMVISNDVWAAMEKNTTFRDRTVIPLNNVTSQLLEPQLSVDGTNHVATLSVQSYRVHIITSDYFLDIPGNDSTKEYFVPYGNILLMPLMTEKRDFGMVYGKVPIYRTATEYTTEIVRGRFEDRQFGISVLQSPDGRFTEIEVVSGGVPILFNKNRVLSAAVLDD